MILATAAFLSLAAACAPNVAGTTLLSIARIESGLNSLAIHDNTAKKSYAPASKEGAVEIALSLLRANHSLDLGVMQLNAENFRWLEFTLEDAFEPCPSLRAAAKHLTAISRYNTGSPVKGFSNGYVGRVLAARHNPAPEPARAETPQAKPEDEPHGWNVFAADNGGGDHQSFLITGQHE